MNDARRKKAEEMALEHAYYPGFGGSLNCDPEAPFTDEKKYESYLQGWTDADSHPDTSDEDELISEAELSECERLEKASTRVVGWYPRPHEKVIKGPFNRWFSIESTKNPIHVKDTASEEEDILFVANAMNMHARLLAEIRRLRARKSQAAEIEKARELLERAKEIITNGETSLSGAMWMKDYYDCVATEELG